MESAKTVSARLGLRNWSVLLIVGLFGQIAWTIENMYLNLFVYKTISDDPNIIASMVAASAIVATLTTLVMGALSDKLGRRKIFIALGYIAWGLSTMAFAFITPANMHVFLPGMQAVQAAAITVIVLDCIMTFFGSTANDAAFNAWVTDVTVPQNRGRVEAVLAVLPLISMLIVFGAFDGLTQKGDWPSFFIIIGALTLVAGVLSLFLMKKEQRKPSSEAFGRTLVYGLKPSIAKANPQLYWAFLAMLISSAATQIYMPYLIIYIEKYLKISNYAFLLAVVLIGSSAISVVSGRFIDRFGKTTLAWPAIVLESIGLLAMYWARSTVAVIAAAIAMLAGFMILAACVNGLIKDAMPEGMAGRFQGVRMIFAVMLPMVIGPFIGSAVITGSAETYEELGVTRLVPTPMIFIAAVVTLLLVALPLYILAKQVKGEEA